MVQDIWKADSRSACQKYPTFFMEHEGSSTCSQKPDKDRSELYIKWGGGLWPYLANTKLK
jgi:hypothetical protein